MATPISMALALERLSPPWLRRSVGGRVMRSIAEVVDDHIERLVFGVRLKFPGFDEDDIDPDAIALIGRERRIRRGPGEPATVYAGRLRGWWDAHKLRGSPYALLHQLDAFFESFANVRMDVVDANGKRVWIDDAVPGVITRDFIVWGADASGSWSRIWVFMYVDAEISIDGEGLTTDGGAWLLTEDGEGLLTDATLAVAELSEAEEEIFKCIPREWSAGHIDKTTVVLFAGDAVLVGYPPRLVSDPPDTVGPTTAPVILEI